MTTTENRVLSVSYGSFSVKLEGFDDPFAIMRRVTEYFRSIAAVDPTFGQKPLIEDLSVLEAIETTVFNDDISLETEGSTITLRPKELEVPRDVFVLGNTDLAPAEEVVTSPPVDESVMDLTAEQQIALANTPLDLREMAQNHEEMPFVGKGPQALDDTSVAQPQSVEMDAQQDTAEQETPLELPVVEETVTETAEPKILDTLLEADNIKTEEFATTPKYRSLSLSDFEPASDEVSENIETPEAQIGMRDKIKAAIAALEAKEAQVTQVEEPNVEPTDIEETPVLEEPSIDEPVVQDTAPEPAIETHAVEENVAQEAFVEEPAAEMPTDQAVDLRDQEPVEKRPLRIIRNEYAYEEPEALEAPTTTPEAPSISVNPFRKFPKREAEIAPAPIPEAPMVEEAATPAPEDDLIFTYRKLRAEHG